MKQRTSMYIYLAIEVKLYLPTAERGASIACTTSAKAPLR